MEELKSCILKAKQNGIAESDIYKSVSSIYRPMATGFVKSVSPSLINMSKNMAGKYAGIKGGKSFKRMSIRKNKTYKRKSNSKRRH